MEMPATPKIRDSRTTYPGGKSGSGVFQAIINRIPPHQVYIEPYLGAGGILRHKRPARISIGVDIDPDVTNAWETFLANNPTPWDTVLQPGGTPNSGDVFRKVSADPALPDPNTKNGVVPRAMQSNTGTPKNGAGCRYTSPDLEVQAAIRIINAAAVPFLSSYTWQGGEFVYLDPPYLPETRKDLSLYPFEMTRQDHIKLLNCLVALPCMTMISGYNSDLYNDTLKGWNSHTFTGQTRQGPATEKIWCNYPEPSRLHDYRYVGETYRKRYRFNTKKQRWINRLMALPPLERNAMFQAFSEAMNSS